MTIRQNDKVFRGTGSHGRRAWQLTGTVSHTTLAACTALMSGLLLSGPAQAGSCTETAPGSGVWVCSGPAAPGDAAQTIIGNNVTVTTDPGFGITALSSSSNAIGIILSNASGDSLIFNDPNSSLISGGGNGIYARNSGTGALSVTSTGTATGARFDGIHALNFASGTDLTISAADTSGGERGIDARNYGSGALSVTSTGAATGTRFNGIYARNAASGSDLTISAADTSGGYSGIDARNSGSGALSVTSTGTATGTSYNGIIARNTASGTDMTISAADTSGGWFGIDARNSGSGALSVTSTGTATGASRDGIFALNAASGSDLTVNAADSSGDWSGIYARNLGSGALSVSSTGAAAGVSRKGIDARNYGTDLTINAADASGGESGIYARNLGSGALSVTSTGTVGGASQNGIVARNYGTDLTINAVDASGNEYGIYARNLGSGALSVTSTGMAMGTSYDGIYARNSVSGSNLTISAADSSGGWSGIDARNLGSGALSVTSTGMAMGTSYDGIYALNFASGADLTVNAANTSGGYFGINAINLGSGALSVTSTGTAAGTSYNGINARNTVSGTDMTISAADSSGGWSGIDARNSGSGVLSVTSTGMANGTSYDGIFARNSASGSDLTVSAADSSGGGFGVDARNYGSGALSVTSTGAAAGVSRDGIFAFNDTYGSDLTISAADTTGDRNGIGAINRGNGALSVTSTGTAAGASRDGIFASNATYGTDLTISAADSSGGENGIYAYNPGSGALSVTSTGTATGTSFNGINARNTVSGTDMTISAADSSGGWSGIDARNYGSGSSAVSVSGTVTGGTEWGIDTFTQAGQMFTINLSSTAVVGATSGNAIRNNASDSTVNAAAGSVINGTVMLGDGSDTVNLAGASPLAGITLLDGGNDALAGDSWVDTLNFSGTWSGSMAGSALTNWETINLTGAAVTITGTGLTTGTINVFGGGQLIGTSGLVISADVFVAPTAMLVGGSALGNSVQGIDGNLTNFGTVDLRGASGAVAAGDLLTVTGNYVGATGSAIVIDTALRGSGSATDLFVVNGDFSGSSLVILNNDGGTGARTKGDGIKLVEVNGTSAPGALTLAGGAFDAGAFSYNLFQGGIGDPADGDYYLRSEVRGIVAPTMGLGRTAQNLALSMLGTLNERMGEQTVYGQQNSGSGFFRGTWGRLVGKDYNDDTARSGGLGDSRSNGQLGGMQFGLNIYRSATNAGAWTDIGVYTSRVWSGTDDVMADSPANPAGLTRSDGWLAGGYVMHRFASDWYVDAVVQYEWLDHRVQAADGTKLENDSNTFLASFELGKSFDFGTGWKVEPQMQLVFGSTDFGEATDSVGILNDIKVSDSLTGRTGLRLGRSWDFDQASAGGLFALYVEANLWGTLAGGETTLIIDPSARSHGVNYREVWGDIGLGTTFNLTRNTVIFTDASVEFGIDQSVTALSARTGIRINW